MSSADFCLINHAITDVTAIGVPFCSLSISQWQANEPRQFLRHALVRFFRLLVKQISPDKNVNCHCTASSFTVSLEPVGFVILGSLTSETQPSMMFLFVSSQFRLKRLLLVRSGFLSTRPRGACSCRRLVVIIFAITAMS